MKYVTILSMALFLFSCGAGQLENSDLEENLFSENGIFNKVNQGDSWSEVKGLAGEYWEIQDDPGSNIFQFRKDIHISSEQILVNFLLLENEVAGIGVSISSVNIGKVGLLIYTTDLTRIYREKFNVDLENPDGTTVSYKEHSFHYSFIEDLDSESPSIQVLCFES